MIDDDRNDIFIILDKKANYRDFLGIKTDKGRLIAILYGEQSIDIQWGDMSLVQAELLVFKTALQHGPYEYLHLLSGQDLPLKTQDCIHKFFDSLAKGTNLVGFGQGELNKSIYLRKRITIIFLQENASVRFDTSEVYLRYTVAQLCHYKKL